MLRASFGLRLAGLLLAAGLGVPSAQAQVEDSLAVPPDSLLAEPVGLDTTAAVGFPRAAPAPPREGGLDHPVAFAARDSLVIVFADTADADGDLGTLFGDARVSYDDATLTAAEVDLLFGAETLRARGSPDEAAAPDSAGHIPGRPQFERGAESFTGRELAYNLSTRRGRIVGARTAIEDGYLLGGVVKQASARVVFAQDATYTTCPLDHPHYGLRAHEMKIVDGEWVYTGPARLHLLGIPTPLWLPFGFFPAAEGRRSGPLPPTYGEDDLGFYLRNLGWYWALSDYMDLQLRGSLWTRGSFEVRPLYRYAKRYAFTGSLDLAYARLRRGEAADPNFGVEQNVSIGWAHQQQLGPTASLNADVNLASRGYLRAISDDFNDNVTQTTQSSVRFQKSWRRAGRSLSVNLRQSQNLTTGQADLTLPNLSFNQSNRYPFRRAVAGAGGARRWYEDISYRYSGSLRNDYRFVPLADSLRAPEGLGVSWLDGLLSFDDYAAATGSDERFRFLASHSLPVQASFAFDRVPGTRIPFTLNLTPSLTYDEDWHLRRTRVVTDEAGRAVYDENGRLQQVSDSEFTPIRRVTAAVSAGSRLFGTFPIRVGPLDGFRHVLEPRASFSYAPDYSATPFDYFRTYTDSLGVEREYAIVSGIPDRETKQLSLQLGNTFQTRVARTDTTGEVQRTALQLFTLDLRSNYDFSADSLRLGQVNLDARTRLGSLLSVNLSARYSPYATNEFGQIIDRYYLAERGRLLRFLGFNLNAQTRLQGRPGLGTPSLTPTRAVPVYPDLDRPDHGRPDLEGLLPYDYRRRDLGYVDFAVPWSLGLDFSYRVDSNPGRENTVAATLSADFDFGLTPTWRLSGRTGYDFERHEITTTRLAVLRDLHCWEMSFNWIPFGDFKSFGFSLYVKSGHLRDILRLDVPKQERSGRFGLAGGGI